jgi:MFS family permease
MTDAARVAAQARNSLMRPLLFGVFARALPLTMLGPLLPGIAASLGATLAQVGWIVATYATGSLIAQPIMGRLADERGRKRIFFACIALFGAGSLASALATSLPWLIIGRVVQALGAGGIQPVATTIIANRLEPQRQGSAIGALYGAFGLGTMAGALCGGGLVATAIALAPRTTGWIADDLRGFPWHLVFWLNVLLALAGAALASSLPNDRSRLDLKPRGYDPLGILLIAGIAAGLMVAATNPDGIAAWGVALTIALLATFVFQERRSRAPLIDPALFAARGPALLYWIALAFGVPSFTLTIYSATFVIMRFHASPEQAGVALFVLAAAYVASAIAGGALISRVSFRALLVCAAFVVAIGIVALALSMSMLVAIVAMAFGGIGLGLASAPPNALLLRYVPRERAGSATGVASMLATSGAITAPALIGTFLAHWKNGDPVDAMRAALAVCGVLAVLCAAIAATLPQPDAVEESVGLPDKRSRGVELVVM